MSYHSRQKLSKPLQWLDHVFQRDMFSYTDFKVPLTACRIVCPLSSNIYLLTDVLVISQRILGQSRCSIISWLLSHIGIRENVLTDRLEETARGESLNALVIWSVWECMRRAGQTSVVQLKREKRRISPLTGWYLDRIWTTDTVSACKSTEVILHGVRLGYYCAYLIIDTTVCADCYSNNCSTSTAILLFLCTDGTYTLPQRDHPPLPLVDERTMSITYLQAIQQRLLVFINDYMK